MTRKNEKSGWFESDWSEAEEQMLRDLWAKGLTCSQIMIAINRVHDRARTRNAVSGKAHRLNLPARRVASTPDWRPPHVFEHSEEAQRLLNYPNENLLRWDD